MAAIPITNYRRYRVGKLKLVLCRYSSGTNGTTNATSAPITRFSKLFGGLASCHVVGQAAQPGFRVAPNTTGSGGTPNSHPGAFACAHLNAATGSYLMIGR